MKALIILASISLLAGVAGGTGLAFVTAPDQPVVADTARHGPPTGPDSTVVVHAPTATDSTPIPAPALPDAGHAASATTSPAEPASPPGAAAVDSTSPPAAPAPTATTGAAPADTLQRTQLRRLSRIFAAMSPREASRVLQQLDDTDVISIVGSLTEKQAAAVLMAMPPDRAAVISRGSLRRAPGRTP